jgi:hypothetical protein
MKAYKENGGTTPLILNLAIIWRRVVDLTLPWETVHGTHSIEGWVGSSARAS